MVDADQAVVEAIATHTGLFDLGDWQRPDLDNLQVEHRWRVATDSVGDVVGAAYFAPEQVSDALWNTYFLAVKKELHGQGVGRFIMNHIEALARSEGIRTLIVETSSLESYEQARGFYQSLGYVREAEIRDYYAAGDNKVVYWKSLD